MGNPTYPIVKVVTDDGLELFGLLNTLPTSSKRVIIHIHGTSGNFYQNGFYPFIARVARRRSFVYLQTNNRGAGNYEYELGQKPHGAALELFEDSVRDLDAWVQFCIEKGMTDVILEAHSFGNEKVIYYMNKGRFRKHVVGIILLGFNDSVGTQQRYENKIKKNYVDEATKLVREGRGLDLLSDIFGGIAGEAPLSARSYLNYYSPGSELSRTMPFRGKELPMYRSIQVPILGLIGDNEDGEYTIIPIDDAIRLMKKENSHTETYKIPDCNHGFTGKEQIVARYIDRFLEKHFS